MFNRGVMKQNLRNIHKGYFHKSSNPIHKATMGINCFKFVVRCIQFDDFTTRRQYGNQIVLLLLESSLDASIKTLHN